MNALYQRIAELSRSGERAAVVTVVDASGSTPREPGAKMIVFADGKIEGTVGGGTVEYRAIEAALEAIETEQTRLVEHELTRELGMCCGGRITLFIEPLVTKATLLIFGCGHVGSALARAADAAGFQVVVADDRAELLETAELPDSVQRIDDVGAPELPFSEKTFVMITTHDHALDQRLVEKAIDRPSAWIGVIGSRRKAEMTKKRLLHRGVDAALVARLRSPVGLAIGAETPQEIAVSILAELIAVRRGALVHRSEEQPSAQLETKAG